MHNALVNIWDYQQDRYYQMHYALANRLITLYPTRFTINPYNNHNERITDMTRLTEKVKMPYQRKYTMEELEGGDIRLDAVEKRNADTSSPYYLCKFSAGKDTGYFSTSLPSLVEFFDKIKPGDLPAEVKLVQQGRRWIIE